MVSFAVVCVHGEQYVLCVGVEYLQTLQGLQDEILLSR